MLRRPVKHDQRRKFWTVVYPKERGIAEDRSHLIEHANNRRRRQREGDLECQASLGKLVHQSEASDTGVDPISWTLSAPRRRGQRPETAVELDLGANPTVWFSTGNLLNSVDPCLKSGAGTRPCAVGRNEAKAGQGTWKLRNNFSLELDYEPDQPCATVDIGSLPSR